MKYETVLVYDLDGNFLAYGIKNVGRDKLQTTNIWPQDQLDEYREQLGRLNDEADVLGYWPDVRDPEVQGLLDNPNFEPLELFPQEVEDLDNSTIVWEEGLEPTESQPGVPDRLKSIFVYKTVMMPNAVEVRARQRSACEHVARKRAREAQRV